MKLDKELYRQSYEQLRQWNQAQLKERAQTAGQRDPQQGWQEFVDLWEFGRQIGVKQSQWQRQDKLAALARYYERVQKLEIWQRLREE